tara:strand:+ start:10263 stop:11267 length:1005 start_codon:yes stop_codon:yes gene_type:complete
MNFKLYIQLFNIISTFCFKQPIPFADSSLSKQGIHKVAIPGNEDVAVWWSMKDQKWNAVHDMCPHRQASLSDGLINPKTNDIRCRYHGLEFNGCGKCTSIPVNKMDTDIFSVKNLVVEEKYDILWLIDDDINIPRIDILEQPTYYISKWASFIEDINYDLLNENFFDPLHVQQVHHGVLPFLNRYHTKFDLNLSKKIDYFNEAGFSFSVTNLNTKGKVQVEFMGPSIIITKFQNFAIVTIVTELKNNSCFSTSSFIFYTKNKIEKKLVELFFNPINFIIKNLASKIFYQDVDIIKQQQKYVNKYGKQYTNAGMIDLPITLYNKWLKKYGDEEQS